MISEGVTVTGRKALQENLEGHAQKHYSVEPILEPALVASAARNEQQPAQSVREQGVHPVLAPELLPTHTVRS